MAKCEKCGKAEASKVTWAEDLNPLMPDDDAWLGPDMHIFEEMLCADCKEKKKAAEDKKLRWMLFILLFVILVISLYDFFFR